MIAWQCWDPGHEAFRAELVALGPAIGRPDLTLMTQSVGAESDIGQGTVARHLQDASLITARA